MLFIFEPYNVGLLHAVERPEYLPEHVQVLGHFQRAVALRRGLHSAKKWSGS